MKPKILLICLLVAGGLGLGISLQSQVSAFAPGDGEFMLCAKECSEKYTGCIRGCDILDDMCYNNCLLRFCNCLTKCPGSGAGHYPSLY